MRAELKVTGGKLLRVDCVTKDGVILHIRITGDFFLHPEEGIEVLEEKLTGLRADEEKIREAVSSFFRGGHLLIGAEPEDIVEVIKKALKRLKRAS